MNWLQNNQITKELNFAYSGQIRVQKIVSIKRKYRSNYKEMNDDIFIIKRLDGLTFELFRCHLISVVAIEDKNLLYINEDADIRSSKKWNASNIEVENTKNYNFLNSNEGLSMKQQLQREIYLKVVEGEYKSSTSEEVEKIKKSRILSETGREVYMK